MGPDRLPLRDPPKGASADITSKCSGLPCQPAGGLVCQSVARSPMEHASLDLNGLENLWEWMLTSDLSRQSVTSDAGM